jgi:hypothetical protein
MYHIKVTITMQDGTNAEQLFDTWIDAAQWIINLATDCGIPSVVTMTMESK